jgi:hypothetical protein
MTPETAPDGRNGSPAGGCPLRGGAPDGKHDDASTPAGGCPLRAGGPDGKEKAAFGPEARPAINRDYRIDLFEGDAGSPYAIGVPLAEALPDAEDQANAIAMLAAEGEVSFGGGAAPLIRVRKSKSSFAVRASGPNRASARRRKSTPGRSADGSSRRACGVSTPVAGGDFGAKRRTARINAGCDFARAPHPAAPQGAQTQDCFVSTPGGGAAFGAERRTALS